MVLFAEERPKKGYSLSLNEKMGQLSPYPCPDCDDSMRFIREDIRFYHIRRIPCNTQAYASKDMGYEW